MDVAAETRETSRSPVPPDNTTASKSTDSAAREEAASTDNKFQQAISSWRNIDLTKLVPTLDTTASDLVNHQKDALVERKELAQKTKDFRKLDDTAKLSEIKGLLKAYQTYIDLISNQSKTVHNSFLHVYSLLSEAPDPYPLLEASVDSLVTVDETVPKLEAENKHLQSNVSKLTSQLEDAEAKLQEETKQRKNLQDQADSKVKEVEASWSAVLTEKQDNWSAKEKSLEERAENQERLLKELKASYEVSQRLDKSGDSENSGPNNASAAELEIVSSDLERANLRLAEVEARNEQLRVELAQNATSTGMAARSVPVEEDPAFIQLRSENSSLMRRFEASKFDRDSDNRSWETQVRSLKREISTLASDCDSLKAKTARWSDYEDVKRELDVLKSIEFTTGDDDEPSEPLQYNSDTAQNLEKLLLARNKKLNDDLTLLRVSHQDLNTQLDALRAELSNSNTELDQSRNLINSLENDLTNLQTGATTTAPSIAGTFRPASSHPRRGRAPSPTSSIISAFDNSPRDAMGGGSGMLPMITAQRDRFKKRMTELETDNSKAYNTISSLRSEIAALQKDNLNLYEKTRYISHQQPPPSAGATSASLNTNPSTVSVDDGAGMERYKSAYESRINPFAAFRGHESMRAVKRMSLPERAFLQTTKVVLRNRVSRNVFAVYFVGLHIVIFAVLWSGAGPGARGGRVGGRVRDTEGTTT